MRSYLIQKRLTSKNLKIETKEARIGGLKLADMLALPMKFLTLKEYGEINELADNFTKRVLDKARSKIRSKRGDSSQIKGYGVKLIK